MRSLLGGLCHAYNSCGFKKMKATYTWSGGRCIPNIGVVQRCSRFGGLRRLHRNCSSDNDDDAGASNLVLVSVPMQDLTVALAGVHQQVS